MKKLILSLSCTTAFAIQCELPENWKRFDKQAGHVLAIGTTIVSSGFAVATGTTTIAAVAPVAVGVAVIAAHSARMNYNKKLDEQKKLLAIEMARHASATINVSPAESPTNVTEKGASQLP
jgi:hypothetical protein